MPDTYTVERSTIIGAAPDTVFAKIVDLREWETWSPWAELDPDMTTTYDGTAGEVGSTYAWQGNRQVGEGSMRIADINAPDQVTIDLKFLKPFKSESVTEFFVAPVDRGTSVTWRMTGAKTLMVKIMGIFKSMDKMVGPDFEKGLAKLKAQLET